MLKPRSFLGMAVENVITVKRKYKIMSPTVKLRNASATVGAHKQIFRFFVCFSIVTHVRVVGYTTDCTFLFNQNTVRRTYLTV
jgi:hypothetical protein